MVKIKPSLGGFNASPRADRSSFEAFIASYKNAFPERINELDRELPSIESWVKKILAKGKKKTSPKKYIPYALYIPDNPNPLRNYRRQAANIARAMREKSEL